MSEKGLGSKLLGIFVEKEEGSEPEPSPDREKSPAEIVAELAQSSGTPRPPSAASPAFQPASVAPGTAVDFDAIFKQAGMDPGELDQVAKAQALLQRLPEQAPVEVRKQIVEASLATFGFAIDKILQAANNQRRALEAFVKVNEAATAKSISEAEAQIRSHNEKIASLKADIERRHASQAQLAQAAQTRKADVQKVVDFFQPMGGPKSPA
jgi:hypothetical protein